MNKYIFEKIFNYNIPLWLFTIIVVPLFLVKLTPLFEFFRNIIADKRKVKEERFRKAEEKVMNIDEKINLFVNEISSLETKYRNNTLSRQDILDASKIFDEFFSNIQLICDGIVRGYVDNISKYQNSVFTLMKYKYDIKDNLMVDCHRIMENAMARHIEGYNQKNFKKRLYKSIFQSYKLSFPLHYRFIAIFCKSILNVN